MQSSLFTLPSDWKPTQVAFLPHWGEAKRIGIDIETYDPNLKTTGPSVRTGGFVAGVGFAIEDGPTHYLPIRHEGGGNLPESEVLRYLRSEARKFPGILVGANLNYDLDFLAEEGITFPNIKQQRDVQIADPLIDELQQSYSLEAVALRHGLPGKDEAQLRLAAAHYGIKDVKADLWRLPGEHVGPYGGFDAELPLRILRRQERIIEEQDLWKIFNLECDLQPVLLKMKRWGVRIDQDQLARVEEWALKEEAKYLDEIRRATGCQLDANDVNKKTALVRVLEAAGVELVETTESGQVRLDTAVLNAIDHPAAEMIRQARKVNKLRTTFAASIRRHMVNGRIHCSFHQLRATHKMGDEKGARFGRLSCSDPNLQQQPSRDAFAPMWRSIYVPDDPDDQWISADFCFSDDTEVLTEHRGFVPFPDLRADDHVAQYKNGEITYALPSARQRVQYSGEMVHVCGDRQVDLLMTPNHNCMLLGSTGEEHWFKARDYHLFGSFRQLQSGMLAGGEDVPESDIITTCAVQADGAFRKTSWRIWIGKERKIQRAVRHLPYSNMYVCEKKGGQTAFTLPIDKVRFLSEKKVFDRALLGMSAKSRIFFLEEITKWDGSRTYYCTTVRENAELVQEIAVLTGVRANLACRTSPGRKPLWVVYFGKRGFTWTKTLRIAAPHYDGYVYCVTMPHHTVVVRRNGRVSVTGQSQQEPRMATHYAEIMGLPKAREAAEEYRTNPKADNHDMMTRLIHPEAAGWDTHSPEFQKIRKVAKGIYLGLVYGMGGAKLAQMLGLPIQTLTKPSGQQIEVAGDEAQALLDRFDARVPYVRGLARLAEARAQQQGYLTTILGRRLRFPRKPDGGYDWTYKALNRLIQGSSGDQIKQVMVDLDRAGVLPQLQVHDEICRGGDMETARRIKEIMEGSLPLRVPSRVDLEVGPSWGQCKEVENVGTIDAGACDEGAAVAGCDGGGEPLSPRHP